MEVVASSPKIKRSPRGRSNELAHYLTRCGVPETPPRPLRIVLEDDVTRTRRALRAMMRRSRLLVDWSGQHADDLARLTAAVPEPHRSVALAAVKRKTLPPAGGPRLARLLAEALTARNRCTEAHLRLAVEYALGVDPRTDAISRLPSADLVQECMCAVQHTAEVYDRWRKAPVHSSFANAAAWWLRHFAEKALREQGHDFRPPGAALSSRTRVLRAVDSIESATGQRPTPEQVAAASGKPARICAQVMEWGAGGFVFASADRLIQHGDTTTPWIELQATPEPDADDEQGRVRSDAVGSALDLLPAAERAVLRAVHGMDAPGISSREYAKRTGIPRQTVDALLAAGETALREALRVYAPVASAA